MKKFITKDYNDIKKRLNIKKNTLLYEGLFLTLISILIYLFDLKMNEFSVLYLFPLGVVLLSIKYLLISCNYKELDMKRWVLNLVSSFVFLLFTLYLVINPISTKELFIIMLGVVVIIKNIFDLIIYKRLHVMEVISFIIYLIFGILLIVFNKVIVNNYLYLVIAMFIIGICNLVYYFIIRKK